jgi:hypothetical protein
MALAMVRRHDEWRRLLILFERRVREGCAGVKPRTPSSYISAGPPIFSAAQDHPPPKHSAPQRITREPRDSAVSMRSTASIGVKLTRKDQHGISPD